MRKISLLMLLFLNFVHSQSSNNIDHLSIVYQIEENSECLIKSDILPFLYDEELPDLYRLGAVICKKFYIESDLVKVELEYEGDRESLIEKFYFHKSSNLFFICSEYMLYSPPKWNDNSKMVLSSKINFIKMNDNWSSFEKTCQFPERLNKIIARKDKLFGVANAPK